MFFTLQAYNNNNYSHLQFILLIFQKQLFKKLIMIKNRLNITLIAMIHYRILAFGNI